MLRSDLEARLKSCETELKENDRQIEKLQKLIDQLNARLANYQEYSDHMRMRIEDITDQLEEMEDA